MMIQLLRQWVPQHGGKWLLFCCFVEHADITKVEPLYGERRGSFLSIKRNDRFHSKSFLPTRQSEPAVSSQTRTVNISESQIMKNSLLILAFMATIALSVGIRQRFLVRGHVNTMPERKNYCTAPIKAVRTLVMSHKCYYAFSVSNNLHTCS